MNVEMTNRKILVVDDDEIVGRFLKSLLEINNYDVDCFLDPLDALETFAHSPGRYSLLITDQTMNRMSGDELAREVHRIREDFPVILCTGHDVEDEELDSLEGIWKVMTKPLDIAELESLIHSLPA